jgi:site-specific recombinase XerD
MTTRSGTTLHVQSDPRHKLDTHNLMGDLLDTDIVDHLFWARDLRGLSPETIRVRRIVLNRLHETIGRPLRDAQAGHLLNWERLVLPGKAPETKRAYIAHIHSFYVWAIKQGIVNLNPAEMLTRPKVPKGLPRPLAEDDLRLARKAAGPKLDAMITLTAYAGLRCMEVAGLHWSDIRRSPDGWAIFVRGKGRKERLVHVGEVVIRAIRAYRWARTGPVFFGKDGGQITPNGVSHVINSHYARLGIQATAHAGRHYYISAGVEETGDVVLMQHLAGHESLSSTQIYAAFSQRKSLELVRALDARAGIAPPGGLAS